jgi:uncharacterized membrane protein YhiD involved in acid resistance
VEYKDFFLAIGTITTILSLVLGVGYFIVRTLIDRMRKSQNDLELSRRRNIEREIENIRSVVEDHKTTIRQNTRELADNTKANLQLKATFFAHKEHTEKLLTKVDKFMDDAARRLERIEGSQLVQAGKDTYILKKGGK